jgi:CRISPR/Cas system-associated endoribonuclease Cas2
LHYTTEDIKKIQESAREAKAKVKQAEKLAKETSKLAKESKKVIEKTKKVAEESKKVIDTILKKVPGGSILEKASKVSSMYGVFAIIGVQAGITAFAAWVSNFVQDAQDKYLEQLSADLTKANGRALANTALIRKQQEQINRLNAES